jgi:hypothetical protein
VWGVWGDGEVNGALRWRDNTPYDLFIAKPLSTKPLNHHLAILTNNLGIIDREAVHWAQDLSPRTFGHSNHECRSQNSELI